MPAYGARFRVNRIFKGKPEKVLIVNFDMSSKRAWTPKVGEKFIIFVTRIDRGPEEIIKMIRANPENQRMVSAAVAVSR